MGPRRSDNEHLCACAWPERVVATNAPLTSVLLPRLTSTETPFFVCLCG
jgi:hypothetical protein